MNRVVAALLAILPLAIASTAGGCSDAPGSSGPLTDPDKLAAPASGEGFQFKTELFPVGPGEEIQDCYFYKVRDLARAGGLPENDKVNLHRVRIVQRSGSHHMNIFRVKDIVKLGPDGGLVQRGKNGQGECFKSPNWATWPLVANTQQSGDLDWTFPDGVANVFEPDEWLMLQTHYVNATSQKSPEGGEVAVNFHTIAPSEVKAELGTVFATKQSIRICKSNPTPSFQGTCQFKNSQPVKIIGANGHFHARGKQFEIFGWDGTSLAPAPASRFYESRTWDEPPMLHSPELDLAVVPNGGVQYACSYQWTPPTAEAGGCEALDAYDVATHKDAKPDCCYTFGPIVERNEHCNAFVYYYPKQADVNCF
jgi:hypothetical protein